MINYVHPRKFSKYQWQNDEQIYRVCKEMTDTRRCLCCSCSQCIPADTDSYSYSPRHYNFLLKKKKMLKRIA